MTVQEDGLSHAALHHVQRDAGGSRELPVVQPLNLDIVCKEKAHPHCHSKPHSHATFITKSQREGPLEKQLLGCRWVGLGCGSFWRNSRCTPSFADNSLLLPAVSKEQGEHARPDMGREGEGGRCLLTGDDVGGRLEVLQPQHPDVQLEDRSSDRHRHFFAVELLSDRSKEPESRDQDSLHREKTERLTRVYFRGGKSHEHQEQGGTALRPPRSQRAAGQDGALWKALEKSVVPAIPLPPHSISRHPLAREEPGYLQHRGHLQPGTDSRGLCLAQGQKKSPLSPFALPILTTGQSGAPACAKHLLRAALAKKLLWAPGLGSLCCCGAQGGIALRGPRSGQD